MPRHTILFVMLLNLSVLRSNVYAVVCASSASSRNYEFFLESKQCDENIEHCLIALGSINGSDEFVRHSYDCWPWPELITECPSTHGICRILHTTGDNLFGTCCCLGDMCNNQSLVYVPANMKDAASLNSIPHDRSTQLSRFGVQLPSRVARVDANHPPTTSYMFLIVLPFLSTIIIVLGLVLLFIRFCTSSDGSFRLKFWTHFTSAHQIRPPSGHINSTNFSLAFRPLGATDPIIPCRKPKLITSPDVNLFGSGFHGVKTHTTGKSATMTDLRPSDADSVECAILQHISEQCKLDKWLGRGRFANVWLAYLPPVIPTEPLDVLLNSEDGDELVSTASQPLATNTTTASESDRACYPFQRCPKDHDISFQLSSGVNCLNAAVTSSERDDLITDGVHCSTAGSYGSVLTSHSQYTSTSSYPVAVKVFAASDYRAWSTEVAVFRALQSPIWSRLTDSPLRADLIGGRVSHPNIIGMLGAGLITQPADAHGSSAPFYKEYHLVVEFAEQGSLRCLLSNGEWIDLVKFFNLSLDIANGLSYLHGDLPEEFIRTGRFRSKPSVAHRDLKPENILIRSDGTACLSDFGQAVVWENRAVKTNSTSSDSGLIQDITVPSVNNPSGLENLPNAGTLRYMAPELLDGAINFTGTALLRTDIYSFGLVLWELLCAVRSEPKPVEHAQASTQAFRDPSSDTFDTPKRQHQLPYERELGENGNSACVMRQWVSVEKRRPSKEHFWCELAPFVHLFRTITECWDPEPEARLTSGCVLERLNALKAEHDASSRRTR